MDMHNLNIRLLENKHILWTCTSTVDPEALYNELLSDRIASGIVKQCALAMNEELWLFFISGDRAKNNFVHNTRAEFLARGVMGSWMAGHEEDEVVILTDTNVLKEDRHIGYMSYSFLHISQVKYPRQYDAPVRKV